MPTILVFESGDFALEVTTTCHLRLNHVHTIFIVAQMLIFTIELGSNSLKFLVKRENLFLKALLRLCEPLYLPAEIPTDLLILHCFLQLCLQFAVLGCQGSQFYLNLALLLGGLFFLNFDLTEVLGFA